MHGVVKFKGLTDYYLVCMRKGVNYSVLSLSSSSARKSLVSYPDPPISAALGVLHHQHAERERSGNSCTAFVCSRGICPEPMGCEMSCDRPHARTECLISEVLSVYSVLVRSDCMFCGG